MTGTRIGLLLILAAAGALLLRPAAVLEIENAGRGKVARYPVEPGDEFSVTYVHSMYGKPVTELFAVGRNGELILTGVRSESGAVLEYFGFHDSKPFHAMDRPMRTIVFRIAAGDAQTLSIAGRTIPFLAFGDRGDRIEARVADGSAGASAFRRAMRALRL